MNITSFRIAIQEPETTLKFYTEVLGMKINQTLEGKHGTLYRLYFEKQNCFLELFHNPKTPKQVYNHDPNDSYWKYSLFVNDIQRVYKQMQNHNISIGEPFQFGEVGYLSHTQDTENHLIEFIQTTFQQNTPSTSPNSDYPLLENPSMGLLTLRIQDPLKSVRFYQDFCDMKIFVRMNVEKENSFVLYFLGHKDLSAPSVDIDAIENREWMYQQRHLFIELQYYWGSRQDEGFGLKDNPLGFQSMRFQGNLTNLKLRLEKENIPFEERKSLFDSTPELCFKSLDNHQIIVTQSTP